MAPKVQAQDEAAIPDIQEMVDRAVAKHLASLGGTHTPGLEMAFSNLATSIAEMTQQQSGRPKPTPPHVMAARQKAQDDLDALLADVNTKIRAAQYAGDKKALNEIAPHWRVIQNFFISTVDSDGKPFAKLVGPFAKIKRRGDPPQPQTIHWSGAPSMALRPINAIAKRIYELHQACLGSAPRLGVAKGPQGQVSKLDNRTYVAMVDLNGNVRAVQTDSVSLNAHSVAVEREILDPGEGSDYGEGNDPRAAETRVLGTLHPATRKNQVDWNRAPPGSGLIEGL